MPAVAALRAATHAAHTALDEGHDTVARLAVLGDRAGMLRRYYRLHAGTERVIAPFLRDDAALDWAARQRSVLISQGLRRIGEHPPPLDAETALTITSRAAALGALYVVEGSTLGGRMIVRQLRERGIDTVGLAFLDPYGARCGAMWRAVLAVLERELGSDAPALAQACAAASATFELASRCLGAAARHDA